jgi:UDP-3-O-[3-hydroxymyristoyl] glucosamine N-acyltransferase
MSEDLTDRIDDRLVREVLGLVASRPFSAAQLGWTDAALPATLTFLDAERYLPVLLANPNIAAAFVTPALRGAVEESGRVVLESADPRYDYHALHNHLARSRKQWWPTEIHPTAAVHRTAFVAERNVRIGAGTRIEPNATILEDVEIGEDCVVRAGAVLGSEGYEHKRTTRGILSVVHDGIVEVGHRVEIGANACIDKGFRGKPTRIGDDTKIDNLVHVAHSVVLGRRCMVVASAMLGGSTVFGDDVWVGPNATVSSVLRVGERASVTLGAVVTRNVEPESRVSGNFAVAHEKFLAFLKTIR